jgi:hypothetical protein
MSGYEQKVHETRKESDDLERDVPDAGNARSWEQLKLLDKRKG